MSQPQDDISRDTLQRLVARALELDEHRTERVSLSKAREVARELGISDDAWDAAIAEHSEAPSMAVAAPRWARIDWRTILTAGAGVAAGALGGWMNGSFNGDADVAFGALLLVAGMVLWARARHESAEVAQARLDAWWLAVPVGMLVAFGEIRTDPLLFAAFSRWGTAWVTSRLPRLMRLLRDPEPPPSASTA
jgi:hypothetical protein